MSVDGALRTASIVRCLRAWGLVGAGRPGGPAPPRPWAPFQRRRPAGHPPPRSAVTPPPQADGGEGQPSRAGKPTPARAVRRRNGPRGVAGLALLGVQQGLPWGVRLFTFVNLGRLNVIAICKGEARRGPRKVLRGSSPLLSRVIYARPTPLPRLPAGPCPPPLGVPSPRWVFGVRRPAGRASPLAPGRSGGAPLHAQRQPPSGAIVGRGGEPCRA